MKRNLTIYQIIKCNVICYIILLILISLILISYECINIYVLVNNYDLSLIWIYNLINAVITIPITCFYLITNENEKYNLLKILFGIFNILFGIFGIILAEFNQSKYSDIFLLTVSSYMLNLINGAIMTINGIYLCMY